MYDYHYHEKRVIELPHFIIRISYHHFAAIVLHTPPDFANGAAASSRRTILTPRAIYAGYGATPVPANVARI